MRIAFLILLSLITLYSCNSSISKGSNYEASWTDTLYSDREDPNFFELEIEVLDATGTSAPKFQIDKEQTVKVRIPRLEKYPIFIRPFQNVSVTNQDSTNGIFRLIPTDTVFTFGVWQDYGENHLFRKVKVDNDFIIEPINGPGLVAYYQTKAKK